MIKLNCPVCDRPGIDTDICPNCETNLSTLRILTELPVVAPKQTLGSTIKIWLLATIFAAFIIGISLGAAGGSLLSQPPPSSTAIVAKIQPDSTPPTTSIIARSYPCTREFYYTVRQGDSLSKIARQFYDDASQSILIVHQNPQLKGRENDLDLDEKLSMPKFYRVCD
jgi:hypothetical protein